MFAPKYCHSAVVKLNLAIGDREIPLFQAAHNFAILRDFVDLPSCDAELLMTMMGNLAAFLFVFLREASLAIVAFESKVEV